MNNKILVIVSDTHCGSVVGLAPPVTTTESGNEIGFGSNVHQAWLWQCWCEGIKRVKDIVGEDQATLLVNGDVTEGVHHRNESEVLAALIDTHIKMAIECFQPLIGICSTRIVTAGTECHTKNMETYFAKEIGALEAKAKDKWLFRINGCLVDAAHHMTTTARAYLEASAMSILMGNARINSMRSGHEVPKVFIRAHRHCGGYFSDGDGMFCVTGAYQVLTRHGFKVVTDSIPRPTMMVLDWRGLPEGSLPHVHQIVFDPPQYEIAIL